MPQRDGTGPLGQGAFTGKGLGNCIAYGIPVIAGAVAALGFGRRRGLGRRNWTSELDIPAGGELSALKNQAQYLEEGLKEIQKRISELENN